MHPCRRIRSRVEAEVPGPFLRLDSSAPAAVSKFRKHRRRDRSWSSTRNRNQDCPVLTYSRHPRNRHLCPRPRRLFFPTIFPHQTWIHPHGGLISGGLPIEPVSTLSFLSMVSQLFTSPDQKNRQLSNHEKFGLSPSLAVPYNILKILQPFFAHARTCHHQHIVSCHL